MPTLTLKFPIPIGEKKLEKLTFRDYATAEDLLAFDAVGPNLQTIRLIASLAGTDEAVIRRMHVDDFRSADAIVSDLLKPHTDPKASPGSSAPAP